MLAVLPPELVEHIAKNLPNKKALRAFTQACSKTLVPGRRYLFRDCRVRVGEYTATVRSFTHDIAHQTDISGAIRCLHLDSYYPDGPAGTQITLCELLTLVHEIPRLESLVLDGFEWRPSPEKVLVRPHPTLANIDLRIIFSECSQACPLEVLCLADRWSSVNIVDFTCGPIAYTLQTDADAHSVRSLCCEWCPITADWNFGFASGCPVMKDLTVVEFRELVDEGCMLVHDVVLQQARTLERLIIRICGDFQNTTLCKSVSAAKSLVRAALTWPVMSRTLTTKRTILAVAISLEYAKLPEVQWTEAEVQAVTELYLEGFPLMSGEYITTAVKFTLT
ncbi:hypothetical protein EIP86_001642 [Pleurotus ostreatoroseus]|nr:hypothetical protein EIP86_001642 [Pleurotus ostreatoroseus]